MENKIEVVAETRPGLEPFGSLVVNDRHIWRFDTVERARVAAGNLALALMGQTDGKITERYV